MVLEIETVWQCDYSGDEVGYPDVAIVGIYTLKDNDNVLFLVDMNKYEILEAHTGGDDE